MKRILSILTLSAIAIAPLNTVNGATVQTQPGNNPDLVDPGATVEKKVPVRKPGGNMGSVRKQSATQSTAGKEPVLFIPRISFHAKSSGGNDYISVQANSQWHISKYPAAWVNITGQESDGLYISYEVNPTTLPRETFMEISNANKICRIEFSQNPQAKFQITDIDFANTDIIGEKFYSDYGRTLYSSDMRYLRSRITYNGPEEKCKKEAVIRITRPDGSVDEGEDYDTPEGFTYKTVFDAEPGIGNQTHLYQWGYDGPNYPAGIYNYEVWVDGEQAISVPLEIHRKAGEPGALLEHVWVEHNVDYNGQKGMLAHIRLSVQELAGHEIRYCMFFYKENNRTKLIGDRGIHLQKVDRSIAETDDHFWEDWSVFMPYDEIRAALGANEKTFTFNIQIQDPSESRPLAVRKLLRYTLPD